MTTWNRWPRRETLVVLGALSAQACATATEVPVDGVEMPPTTGIGGDAAGMTSMAGNAGVGGVMSGGGKGGAGASGGGGSGGSAGSGGANAGGAGMGGMGAAGATGGAGNGTGGGGAGAGGASAGTTALGGNAGGSGKGGAAATGGQAGTGGSSGAGGKAGAGGNAGTGGKAGTGGTGNTEASGCAELSVPLNAADDKAHFTISLSNAADFSDSGTTISMRVYVEAGTGGRIFAYAQDADYNFLGPADRPLLADQDGWVTLTWNVAAEPGAGSGIAKGSITRIGIEIQAAPSMSWSNPTVVFVDSISANTTPALSFPFGTSGTVSTATNQTTDPSGQALWINAGSTDTTASGTTLDWVATCP